MTQQHNMVLASHKALNDNTLSICNCSKALFLYLKCPSGVCEGNTNNSVDTPSRSLSFPHSSADESDGSVNCIQLGDWLQHWWGKNSVSSPESLFHMNYYALYFVLNMHCVPHGALKMIWQQFGAYHMNIHIKARVHKMCLIAYKQQAKPHTHAHTSKLIFSCSVFIYLPILYISQHIFPFFFIWMQKPFPPRIGCRGGGSRKDGSAENFLDHLWLTFQITVWKSTSVSITIHQPSEDQLLHQQALKDT